MISIIKKIGERLFIGKIGIHRLPRRAFTIKTFVKSHIIPSQKFYPCYKGTPLTKKHSFKKLSLG